MKNIIKFLWLSLLIALTNQAFAKPAKNLSHKTETITFYNLKSLNTGFKKLEIKNNQLIFDDRFIDGVYTDGTYQGNKVNISNCQDLERYDLRQLERIVQSDRNLLMSRKLTCHLINDNGINHAQAISSDVVNKKVLNQTIIKTVINHFFEPKERGQISCSNSIDDKTVDCIPKNENHTDSYHVFITPIFSDSNQTTFIIEEAYVQTIVPYKFVFNNKNQLISKREFF